MKRSIEKNVKTKEIKDAILNKIDSSNDMRRLSSSSQFCYIVDKENRSSHIKNAMSSDSNEKSMNLILKSIPLYLLKRTFLPQIKSPKLHVLGDRQCNHSCPFGER
ncbi:hypothetical protein ACHAXS_008142 [Conticribra weissflogii]